MAELTMLFEAVISKNAFLMYLQQLRQRDWKTVLSLGDKVTGTGDTIAICCLCLRTPWTEEPGRLHSLFYLFVFPTPGITENP